MTVALRGLIRMAKSLAIQGLYHSRLLHAWLAWRLRNRAVVLMYHRVLPSGIAADSFSADQIVVSPETFEFQMAFVKRHLHPMSAADFENAIASGQPLPSRSCLVTFDDGWWDNVEYALPALERSGVPVVVFVATDYIGTERCFWQERMARTLFALWKQGDSGRQRLRALGIAQAAGESSARDARRRIRDTVTAMKSLPVEMIESALMAAEEHLEAVGAAVEGTGPDRFMSWTEVQMIAGHPLVTVGSHCCSHTPLTKLDATRAADELERSRRELTSRTARPVYHLAYPNGDCNDQIAELAKKAGYRLALTTAKGHVQSGDDPMRIRRVNVYELACASPAEFVARLAGLR